MFSVNSVTLNFCKLFFCHRNIENVACIDAFKVVPLPAAKQRIFNHFFKICPFLCNQSIS